MKRRGLLEALAAILVAPAAASQRAQAPEGVVLELIEQRILARKRGDPRRAEAIARQLRGMGVRLRDVAGGTSWELTGGVVA